MKMDNGDWIAFEIEVTKSGDRATYTIDRAREGQTQRVEEVTIQLAGPSAVPAAAAERSVYTKVTILPAARPAGAYQAIVEICDVATGEVLSTPSIVFLRGTTEACSHAFGCGGRQ